MSPEERARRGVRALGPLTPREVIAQGTRHGILVPTVAHLEVEISSVGRRKPRTARGWLSTLEGSQELLWSLPRSWPAGCLIAVGAILALGLPAEDERRLPCLTFGSTVLAVRRAGLVIPGGWALVHATWSLLPDGKTAIKSGTEILRHDISAEDHTVAGAAYRWLRGLRPAGRHSIREELDPARAEFARKGWAIKQEQPALGWDKIAPRVGAPNGKTLSRWVKILRQEES